MEHHPSIRLLIGLSPVRVRSFPLNGRWKNPAFEYYSGNVAQLVERQKMLRFPDRTKFPGYRYSSFCFGDRGSNPQRSTGFPGDFFWVLC